MPSYSLLFMVVKAYLNTNKESTFPNTRHTIGNNNGGKARTTRECITTNTRHAIGDGDGGKTRTRIESMIPNARYAVGNNSTFRTSN